MVIITDFTKKSSKNFGIPEWIVKGISNLANPLGSIMDIGGEIADLVNLKQNLFEVECKIKSAEALDLISEVEIALIR